MGTTKKKPPFLTIYTVSSIDGTSDDPIDFDVIGSYASRGDAIRAFDRVPLRSNPL